MLDPVFKILTFSLALSLAAIAPAAFGSGPRMPTDDSRMSAIDPHMLFEPNVGQFDERVRFLARGERYRVWVTDEGATIDLRGAESGTDLSSVLHLSPGPTPDGSRAAPRADGPVASRTNRYAGTDADDWRIGIPNTERVVHEDVYPGIDVAWYGRDGELEFDYIVAPGADTSGIRLFLDGATDIALNARGELDVTLPGGRRIVQRAPVSYQDIDGVRRPVDSRYELLASREVGFVLGEHDPAHALTIDPVVSLVGIVGGSRFDQGWSITSRPDGSVVVSGTTSSLDFPGAPSVDSFEVLVTRLEADGSVRWSTVFGGDGFETALAHAFDAASNAVWLTGILGEPDDVGFPVTADAYDATPNGGRDAFVARVSVDTGELEYATHVGGSLDEYAEAIAVDSTGRVWIGGNTEATSADTANDLPTTANAVNRSPSGGDLDGFLIRLDGGATALGYGTFLGGDSTDVVKSVTADSAGGVWVSGGGGGSNVPFPTTSDAYDSASAGDWTGWIARFSATGSLAYSTMIGGSDVESVTDVVLGDTDDEIWFAATTSSTDFPTTSDASVGSNPGGDSSVIGRFDTGNGLLHASYVGGDGDDFTAGLARDANGRLWVVGGAGESTSTPFPRTTGSADAGVTDAYIARVSEAGVEYAETFGGEGFDAAYDIAIDGAGSVWVTGETRSDTMNRAFTGTLDEGNGDLLLVRVDPSGDPEVVSPVAGSVVSGDAVTLRWSLGDSPLTNTWVYVGSTAGTRDIADSGALGVVDSFDVVGLPTDGREVFVRLWYRPAGEAWQFIDHSFFADSVATTPPSLSAPASGSVLASAEQTFSWNAGTSNVTGWWLYVGSAVGATDRFNSGLIDAATTSRAVGSLPLDGRTLHVRLWYRIGGAWQSIDETYTAATAAALPVIDAPVPGAILSGASETFAWSDASGSIGEWWLYVGPSVGSRGYFDSGNLQGTSSVAVTGLPTNGSTVHVRLWYRATGGAWSSVDRTYTAASGGAGSPAITTPVENTVLDGDTVTFEWSDNGTSVDEWWLYVGSTIGGRQYVDSGNLGDSSSVVANGLPRDGTRVYVRLWYREAGGSWSRVDSSYIADE